MSSFPGGSVPIVFESDLRAASAQYQAFVQQVQSRPLSIQMQLAGMPGGISDRLISGIGAIPGASVSGATPAAQRNDQFDQRVARAQERLAVSYESMAHSMEQQARGLQGVGSTTTGGTGGGGTSSRGGGSWLRMGGMAGTAAGLAAIALARQYQAEQEARFQTSLSSSMAQYHRGLARQAEVSMEGFFGLGSVAAVVTEAATSGQAGPIAERRRQEIAAVESESLSHRVQMQFNRERMQHLEMAYGSGGRAGKLRMQRQSTVEAGESQIDELLIQKGELEQINARELEAARKKGVFGEQGMNPEQQRAFTMRRTQINEINKQMQAIRSHSAFQVHAADQEEAERRDRVIQRMTIRRDVAELESRFEPGTAHIAGIGRSGIQEAEELRRDNLLKESRLQLETTRAEIIAARDHLLYEGHGVQVDSLRNIDFSGTGGRTNATKDFEDALKETNELLKRIEAAL